MSIPSASPPHDFFGQKIEKLQQRRIALCLEEGLSPGANAIFVTTTQMELVKSWNSWISGTGNQYVKVCCFGELCNHLCEFAAMKCGGGVRDTEKEYQAVAP